MRNGVIYKPNRGRGRVSDKQPPTPKKTPRKKK